jgi:small-conductance mechanosensitive channel
MDNMDNLISMINRPFFSVNHQIIIPLIIIAASFIIGIITEKVIIHKIKRIFSAPGWKSGDIILNSLRGNVFYLIVISGLYSALFQSKINEQLASVISKILLIILILLITRISAKILTGFVSNYLKRHDEFSPSSSIFSNITRLIVFIIGILIILQSLGISITPLLTALGVGGLAAALALQDTLSNLFAGIQIIASGKIRQGDYIKLENGLEGYIADISLRNTIIRQITNNSVIIPNLKITTAIIINYSNPEKNFEFFIDLGIDYSSDLEKAEKIVLQTARELLKKNEMCDADFEPVIIYSELASSSINMRIKLRVKEFMFQGNVKHLFIKMLIKKFRTEKIIIPFPVRTVHLKK